MRHSASELYCRGVFTTLNIAAGQPFLWEKHWRRLVINAQALGIDLSGHSEEDTLNALLDSVAKSGLTAGRARITFSDETPGAVWSNGERRTDLSIIVAERRPIPENFKLTTSPHRVNTTSPLAGIKSCNYLEHLMAFEEASKRGFHEAVRLNERGEIASACMANVFWEKDGRLYTPSLKTSCLPGTTREFVLENLDCEEIEWGIEDLESADRILLTSAGIGVVTVAEFNCRRLDNSEASIIEDLPILFRDGQPRE